MVSACSERTQGFKLVRNRGVLGSWIEESAQLDVDRHELFSLSDCSGELHWHPNVFANEVSQVSCSDTAQLYIS